MGKVTEIEQLAVSLSLEASSFTKQMQTIDKTIKNSEKSFKNAGKGIEGYEKTYVGLDAKIQKTSKQLDLYNIKLDKQKEEYISLESVVTRQKEKLTTLETTLGKGSDEWKKQAELVAKNSTSLNKMQTDITGTNSSVNKLTNELEKSQKEFQELGIKTQSASEKLSSIEKNTSLTESSFNKLGAELEQNGTFFQKLGNEMNQLVFKIDDGVQKIKVYESEVTKLSSELEKNKANHSSLKQEINSTETELSQVKKEFGENSTEAAQLGKKLLGLKDDYNRLDSEIGNNKNELNRYQTELNNTEADVQRLSVELRQMPFDEVGNKLKSTGQTTKEVGQGLTAGVTVPFALAGAGAVKAGVEFDTAMSQLQATSGITDKTSESFKALEEKALEMGAGTSFGAGEAAEGMNFLALAGWDVATSIERIEPVLRAAEASGMELGLTADLITDSMSAAGVSSEDFGKYLDISAQAQRKSNQSMQQLYEANIVAGGSFKMLNIPLEESGALLGVLANRGIKGSESGKALSSVFANLITETGQAGDALTSMNISLFDGEGKQKDMIEVLKELRGKLIDTADGTSELTEEQQAQYAAMLGGKTQFDTLMALLDGMGTEYDNLVVDLNNADGALDEVATTMKDNLGGEIETMKSAIEGGLIKAFVAMEPVLSKVIECVTDAANWFSSLDEEGQKNIIMMAGVAMAIGPLLMGVGQLIIVGGNAVTLFGKMGTGAAGASAATGGLTGAMGILASPIGIGLAVAAIVGLIAAIGDNENALLKLQEKFGGLGTVIGSVCEFISGVVQLTFGNLAIVIMGVFDIIGAIIDGPGGATVSGAWDTMNNKLILNNEEAMSKITLTTTRGMSQMLHASEEALTGLVANTDVTLAQIPMIVDGNYKEAAKNLGTSLATMDKTQLGILQGMNDTTKQMFQGINEGMSVDEATNQVEVNLNQMSKAGKINGDAMTSDITEAMDSFKGQLSEKTKGAADEVDTNTKEVATVTETNTKEAAESAEKNMDKAATETKEAAKDMSKSATSSANEMKKNVTTATDDMASEAISDWNKIRTFFSNPIYGSVSVQRTTTETTKKRGAIFTDNSNELTRGLDISSYKTRGAYYSLRSSESTSLNNKSSNIEKSLEKCIKKFEDIINNTINSDSEKIIKIEIPIYMGTRQVALETAEIVMDKITRNQESDNKGRGIS